jgi:hypothetical protein
MSKNQKDMVEEILKKIAKSLAKKGNGPGFAQNTL